MINRTMMPHPMHLHGHELQVVEIDGRRFAGAVRDTVLVPPGKRVVVAFDANNPGYWTFPLPPSVSRRGGHVHDVSLRLIQGASLVDMARGGRGMAECA